MKKIAMVAVSIGVIFVIAGLVMVGIFGGEAIKNINWTDIVNGTSNNLESATSGVEYGAGNLDGITGISVKSDRFSVYVLPSDTDVLSVKYVDHLEHGVKINVEFSSGVLHVTETDNLKSIFWNGLFNKNRFVVVYVPQTELFTSVALTVNAETAGIKVQDVTFASVKCVANTGGINLIGTNVKDVNVSATTGSVNVNRLSCDNLIAKTTTGSVNVDETAARQTIDITVDTGSVNCHVTANKLIVDADTGSVNFTAEAADINVKTDTGSVNGTVLGNKDEYNITAHTDTGKCNISNQTVANATKFLTVEVDTGKINITFDK